jgi:predicted RNA binding protein YcfA (HicA-like mRNA interferase family)
MKVQEVIRLIEADGWYLIRTRGSHRQYHHPMKPGTVTIPGKLGAVVQPGLLNSILRQAQIRIHE